MLKITWVIEIVDISLHTELNICSLVFSTNITLLSELKKP